MSHCENKETGVTKQMIIGWVMTILISVAGAFGGAMLSMNSRSYSQDKRIELVELRVSMLEIDKKDQAESNAKFLQVLTEVRDMVLEMKATKADKKFTN